MCRDAQRWQSALVPGMLLAIRLCYYFNVKHSPKFEDWVHLAQWLDRMAYVPGGGSSKLSARGSAFSDFRV